MSKEGSKIRRESAYRGSVEPKAQYKYKAGELGGDGMNTDRPDSYGGYYRRTLQMTANMFCF